MQPPNSQSRRKNVREKNELGVRESERGEKKKRKKKEA